MARLHTNVLKWGNKYDGPNTYKHGRRGALDDAFWDEDELVDFPSHKKKEKKVRAGCPGNDMGPHVYVWLPYAPCWSSNRYEVKVCCGCEKRSPNKSFRSIK
jgi:hypothetical protein